MLFAHPPGLPPLLFYDMIASMPTLIKKLRTEDFIWTVSYLTAFQKKKRE